MDRRWLSGVLVLLGGMAIGQPYGNEWIDYGAQYWRFNVHEEGIHRIDSTALANAGFPVGSVDPRDIQLFAREQQVPIYVEGEDDGVFNDGDFIEFHGQGNDGWLDAGLWDLPQHQNNPYYSLYNDTIRYYLSWSTTGPKERVTNYSNTDFASHVPRDWFWYEALRSLTGRYQVGERDNSGASDARMVEGEGWFNSAEMVATSVDISHNQGVFTRRPYQGADAPDASVTVVVAGTNNPGGGSYEDHHLRVTYGGSPGIVAVDTVYRGYRLIRSTFPMPAASLSVVNTVIVTTAVHDLFGPGQVGLIDPDYPDRQVCSHVLIRYPHETHMNNEPAVHVDLDDDPNDDHAFLDFNVFPGTPLCYSVSEGMVRRIMPTPNGNRWNMLVPDLDPDGSENFLFNADLIDTVSVLSPVNGTGYFVDHAQLEQDSAVLLITHGSLMNEALQYAAYRENSPRRPAPVVLLDVDELYDQYGGGIPKHALAIRRVCERLLDEWNTRPQALFLVGKSVVTPRVGSVTGSRIPADSAGYKANLVPTFGYPPSDVSFTLGLGNDPREVSIPVGRLSARTGSDVTAYLGKVQSFEGFTVPEAWMKNIIHFRGGFTPGEWASLGAYLAQFKQIAQDTCFGGRVVDFVKNSSAIYQQAPADSVAQLIDEEGVTLMTFFAHAAGGGFDINIDNPANYAWNGKHPMIIGNSCYAGNIHLLQANSASEEFVLLPGKGAIAFLASVDIGLTTLLGAYTTEFYRSFSAVNYGGTIGQHAAHASFEQLSQGSDVLRRNNVQTFTLEGDPMLVLHSWPEPDYSVSLDQVRYLPEPVTSDLDSVGLQVVVRNLGKATGDRPAVRVVRTLQGGDVQPPLSVDIDGSAFQDTARFQLPIQGIEGSVGANLLDITVDLDPDEVPEMEDIINNRVLSQLLITSGDIRPVDPYPFAIVPGPEPLLEASTGDPFAPLRTYVFQIDTTDTYDSPVMEQYTVDAPGGVVPWQPGSIYDVGLQQDSVVYYWRCSPDSTGNGGYNWYESSFQVIPDRTGWGQAHFFQFKGNGFDQVVFDRPGREFDFFTGQRSVRTTVQGNSSGSGNDLTQWYIDLTWQDGNGCGSTPAFHVAVIDPATFTAWGTRYNGANPDHFFGNVNDQGACRSRVEYYFIFRQNDPAQLDGMLDMLQNAVPDGHYVLVYTWKYLNRNLADQSNPDLFDELIAMGADSIRAVTDSVPYIFFTRKGDPIGSSEAWGTSIGDLIQLEVDVTSQGNTGGITSPLAGPALSWEALYWNEVPDDPQDSARVLLYGRTPFGTEQLLFDRNAPEDSLTALTFPAFQVDAAQFPWIRLETRLWNDSVVDPRPAQLQRWQLLCGPAPECAIDPPSGYFNGLEGWYEGQTASVAVAVRNISEYDMDSLLITAWIVDQQNERIPLRHGRSSPLPAGGILLDTISFPTQGLGGWNTLVIEANGIDSATMRYDQPEMAHFNNIAQLRFEVDVDRENPLLDVTFDGIHILDGDIVSARPEIEVSLDDENPVLLLDSPSDTAYFKVFLQSPDGQLERIYFRDGTGQEQMQFIPADGPENESRIHYRPTFEIDGRYALLVQARDVSNNLSGDNDYRVSFEVINRPTITEVLNYPNPFTTSTRFVFTITGREPPTYMKVQIMTVTGRVVREVTMQEIGTVRVGRNISEFAWDGTDEFGDRLARGVYLYRVIAKLHGEDIEVRSTAAGGFFEQGYGKMYLLR